MQRLAVAGKADSPASVSAAPADRHETPVRRSEILRRHIPADHPAAARGEHPSRDGNKRRRAKSRLEHRADAESAEPETTRRVGVALICRESSFVPLVLRPCEKALCHFAVKRVYAFKSGLFLRGEDRRRDIRRDERHIGAERSADALDVILRRVAGKAPGKLKTFIFVHIAHKRASAMHSTGQKSRIGDGMNFFALLHKYYSHRRRRYAKHIKARFRLRH